MDTKYKRIDRKYHKKSGCGLVLASCVFRVLNTEYYEYTPVAYTVKVVDCKTKYETSNDARVKIEKKYVIGATYRIAANVLIDCNNKGEIQERGV